MVHMTDERDQYLTESAPSITTPTQVIWGDNDRVRRNNICDFPKMCCDVPFFDLGTKGLHVFFYPANTTHRHNGANIGLTLGRCVVFAWSEGVLSSPSCAAVSAAAAAAHTLLATTPTWCNRLNS